MLRLLHCGCPFNVPRLNKEITGSINALCVDRVSAGQSRLCVEILPVLSTFGTKKEMLEVAEAGGVA